MRSSVRQSLKFLWVYLLVFSWSGAALAQTKWDFFIFVPLSHPVGQYSVEFSDLVKKETGGRLQIVVRPPGELPYKATEVVRVVSDGNVQLGDAIAGWVGGESAVAGFLGMPYLLASAEELSKVWPKVEPVIQVDLHRWGVRVLHHYYFPEQQFWGSGDPIRNLADIKGKKIRVTSPELGYLVKQLGGESVSFTASEVPTAIQRGAMSSLTTSMLNLIGSRWDEFVKWGYIANTNVLPCYIVVNEAAFKKLPEDVQAGVVRASRQIQARMAEGIPGIEAAHKKALIAKGITLYEQSPADRKRATELMMPYWQEQAEKIGPRAVQVLKSVRETLGK